MSEQNGATRRRRSKGNGVNALFADGTEPGGKPMATALGEALAAMRKLEQILTADGGYMTPEDQDALRSAREILRRHGR